MVTCRDVEVWIAAYASGRQIPGEAAVHIAECAHCRQLAEMLAETPQAAPPFSAQLEQIEAAIVGDLKPVKPLPAPGLLVCVLLFICTIVAAGGCIVLGSAGWHALSAPQRAAIFAALATAAAVLAASTVRQILPASNLLLSPYLLSTAVLVGMAGICAALFHPRPEPTFVATGLVCLRIGVTCAIAAACLSWLLLRRGAVLQPLLTGVTVGTLAGLTGLTVLEIFCPNLNEFHILAWHLGAVLVSAVCGFAIGMIAEYRSGSGLRRTA